MPELLRSGTCRFRLVRRSPQVASSLPISPDSPERDTVQQDQPSSTSVLEIMVKPKQILNQPANAVSEFIEGLLIQYPNHLKKLENHHVLLYAGSVSSTSSPPGVQLISGGGSGHEPSHAGWLGHGMLSGAVCGGIFASPSVSSILATIRVLAAGSLPNKRRDILLIIKNYTGDRLNFGMAAEMAGQEGIHVKMVVRLDSLFLCEGIHVLSGLTQRFVRHAV